jgi:PAS domain S-box-containing protein
MRVKLPLLRIHYVLATRAPVLRYSVALLSIFLALIPAFLLSDVFESRLVVFAVAIMVSAWYGGWKPGLVATAFAVGASAYFSIAGAHSASEYRKAIIHLTLFVFVALLICWFNAALRSAQEALRRSETNFRSLVTNAPYGICRCDSAGIILNANPAFVQALGYSSPSDLRGQNLANLYADSQEWFTLADHFRTLKPFTGVAAEWIKGDNRPIIVRISGRAIRDENKTIFFELFAEDVTERRALEQQLRHAQKMEAVGRLAGGIAHDFNNILMVISGYSEFLVERVGNNQEIRIPVQEIAKAAQRATGLTRQLLAFSRKQMLAPKVLDLNEVVTENLKMLTRVIGEDIDLVMIPGTDLGSVKADPNQIEQVIMNLAVNARDAMPQGGKLTIETSNVTLDENYARLHGPARPGEYVMIAISDTGMGMDSETQTHIFDPFFTTKGTKGTGLGLSTVYGIVKQSEGYIWVYSEPAKGTTFKVYLPRVSETGESVEEIPASSMPDAQRNTETILVVEDEPTLLELGVEYLRRQGYSVMGASDGETALQLAQSHDGPIHLLLSDVIMPDMNGRQLARHLTALRPEVKVLYMSGYTENVIGHNGTLDQGVALLQKPFTLPALKAKVREVLDTPLPQEIPMSARVVQMQGRRIREKLTSPFRAQRFNLQLPLKYRLLGEDDWRTGTTENISRSGMLFRAEEMMPPAAQLEINLVLPAEIAGVASAEVVCRGEVVRTIAPETPNMNPALAAKILQYHFQHSSPFPQA